MSNPVQHPEAHLFHYQSIHLPSPTAYSFISHPSLCLTVRPLICGGPPRKTVSFPATAPWVGLTWKLERGTEEARLQSNMRCPNDLQLQHHPQQLDLRRGDPTSRWHPSQVTCYRINSKWKLPIFSTHLVLEQSFSQRSSIIFSTLLAYMTFLWWEWGTCNFLRQWWWIV